MLSLVKQAQELFNRAKPLLAGEIAKRLEDLFIEKTKGKKTKILLYGPYNAGKTMLINALAGEKLFKSGEIPETDKLYPVTFKEYELVDSPGFNAPNPSAELISKQAVKWDADLVLFVITNEGLHEDDICRVELNDLFRMGRNVILIVNEKKPMQDEKRDEVANQLGSRVAVLLEEHPQVFFEGPLFVNAETALRARLEGKTLLEEYSRIGVIEDVIHRWLAMNGRYAGLVTFTVSMLEELRKARLEVESRFVANNPQLLSILCKLDEIMAEMETFVQTEVRARTASLEAVARAIIYSKEPHQINLEEDILQKTQQESELLVNRVFALLYRRLVWAVENISLVDLKRDFLECLKIGQNNLEGEFKADIHISENISDLSRYLESLQDLDFNTVFEEVRGQYVPVGTSVVRSLETLQRAGAMRTLARMGTLGKVVSKGVKFAPFFAVALDIITVIGNQVKLHKARKQAEERIRERARQVEALRNLLEQQISRAIRDAMETTGDYIMAKTIQTLLSIRNIVQQQIQEIEKTNIFIHDRLVSLNNIIADCQGFLEIIRSNVGQQ